MNASNENCDNWFDHDACRCVNCDMTYSVRETHGVVNNVTTHYCKNCIKKVLPQRR